MSPDDSPSSPIDAGDDDARTVVIGSSRTGAAPAGAAPPPRRDEPALPHNALPPGTRLAEFEIVGLVGEGGFGIVYLADDTSLDRRVAVKEYMPSALAARGEGGSVSVKSARHADTFEVGRKSFINEARLLARFDHPSLIKVYRFWEENGTAYMAMPFYEGDTLKQALAAMDGPPDEAWLRGLLAPLLDALTIIHGEQCFHRDIAPDNILLLKGSNRPLLLDFGAARRVIGGMTQDLTIILKPGYAPVEQYAEVPAFKQGPWTDLYALAAVVHFAIRGKTPPEAVGRMLKDSYVPLAQEAAGRYSPGFLQAIDRALAVSPERRPQNVRALADDLGIELGATHQQGATHAPRPVSRSRPRWPWLAAAAAAVLLGGFAAVLLRPDPPPAPAASSTPTESPSAAPDAPAPPAAPALPPYTPAAELARLATLGDPGIVVQAEPASPVARIGRDSLSFTVRSNASGYLYIFMADPDGKFVQLFPNGIDGNNRIQADRPLRLPRATWPMDASEPAGVNRFVALVSPTPRDFGEAGLAPDGVLAHYPAAAQTAAAGLRRPDYSPFAGRARCQPDTDCNTAWGAATFDVDVRH